MDNKHLAHLLDIEIPEGFVPDVEMIRPFGPRLQILSQSLPVEPLKGILRELTEKKRLFLTKYLKLPIRTKLNKSVPYALLTKAIFAKLQQKNGKGEVLHAILVVAFAVYGEEEMDESVLLEKEDQIIKEYGYWHFYWALLFFPDRTELIEGRLTQLAGDSPRPFLKKAQSSQVSQEAKAALGDKQIKVLKQKVEREGKQRQQAEREAIQLQKELKGRGKHIEQLTTENHELKAKFMAMNEREQEFRLVMEEKERQLQILQKEKAQMLEQIRMAERELAGLRESAATYEGELKRSKLRLAIERSKPDDPVQLTKRLLHCLYFEQDLLCKSLPQGEGGSDQRQKIRKLFDLIDQLEQSIQEEVPTPVESPPAAVVSPPQAEEDDVESIPGTFYRGDHGGRIYLENREAFNITESMVHDHHLQHEAEVQCKPSHQENSHIQYEIERILFQGDDRYSPVRHFMGYVELGEHFTWYCVDMNNSENRYLLHDKDVHIQKPQDGDACAFNVLAGNHVARLSRLYREMPVEDKSQSVKKYPVKKEEDKSKRAPFLTGCRIVIIGGLAKWFESVITETGAELVHETGDHPERIHAELRRADALFMLLTATSHRATWSCIEIAKQNRVPHFTIEGSKSNLRMQLWEHREKIRGKKGNSSATSP